MSSAWSPELLVMLRPAAEYRQLVELSNGGRWWKRALRFSFLFGSVVSLAASGRLTLRLVAAGTLYASLIPLVEIAVLAAVLGRSRKVSLARAADLFLMGHGAWCCWLLGFAGIWAFLAPIPAFEWTRAIWRWGVVAAVAAWSAYVDYCFFRCVAPSGPGWRLVVQRVACWTPAALIFGGGSLWPEILKVLGR